MNCDVKYSFCKWIALSGWENPGSFSRSKNWSSFWPLYLSLIISCSVFVFPRKTNVEEGGGGGRLGQDLAVFLKLFLVLGKEISREGDEGGRWPPARWQCIPAGKHKIAIFATPHWLFDHDKPGQRMTDPVACDGQSSWWLRFRIRTWAALRNPGSADPCIAKNNPCSVIN